MKKKVLKANLMLVVITLLWGLTFPLIKEAIVYISPSKFVLLRFILATLFFLPLLKRHLFNSTKTLLLAGLVLGVLNSGIFLFQTIGLQTISASRSAFITGTNVLLVPFLLPLFGLGVPKLIDIIAAFFSLFGIYILTGANVHYLLAGDFWTLACAVCYALAIVFIQWVTPKVNNSYLLSFYQILLTIPIIAGISMTSHSPLSWWNMHVIIALLFCSLGATVIAFYWQIEYQQRTTATQAALIYCLEPVFASIFSYFINDSVLTKKTILGGGIIFIGMMLPLACSLYSNSVK